MTPRRYRRKPVEVEAVQWTGENFEELRDFIGTFSPVLYKREDGTLWASWFAGDETEVRVGDAFVKDGKTLGQSTQAEFEATYESVEDGPGLRAEVDVAVEKLLAHDHTDKCVCVYVADLLVRLAPAGDTKEVEA